MRIVRISSYIITNSEQCEVRTARDACSWKGQLERTRSWKVLSWKVSVKVGKREAKLESFAEVGKNTIFVTTFQLLLIFPSSIVAFQLH